MKHELEVAEGVAGRRLDLFLAGQLDVSRSQVQRWLKAGAVTVNDRPERAGYEVAVGDRVVVTIPEAIPAEPVIPPQLPVVYEDDDLLVVDKPAGLAVHAGAGRPGEPTVTDFARLHTTDPDPDRPGIVHRLDRDTSGLLVLAKTAAAKAALQQQWRDRTVHKTYQLLAVGRVEPAAATIDLPLGRDDAHPTRRRVTAAGKPARTRYHTLATYPGATFIEAQPETGRTHQLRVHFAALGHPIAGDVVYGPAKRPFGLRRQFLHAAGLELVTPSGQPLKLTSPLPTDLIAVLRQLEGFYN